MIHILCKLNELKNLQEKIDITKLSDSDSDKLLDVMKDLNNAQLLLEKVLINQNKEPQRLNG